jgi:hypothetical protein
MKSLLLALALLLGAAPALACQPYAAVQDAAGNPVPGYATMSVLNAGTRTLSTVYSDPACTTAKTNPITRGSDERWSFWAKDGIYDLEFTLGNIRFEQFYSVPLLGSGLASAVNVKDAPYSCTGNGVTDETACIQLAINSGLPVIFPKGAYQAHGLTQSTNGQVLIGIGEVIIQKNANGVLFSSTGHDVQLHNLKFYGDASTPTFTGDNLNFSGNNPTLINCGSRWAFGRAVKATGQHLQIIGTNDIYETGDQTATGYDIELGVSGTATLYHTIIGWYSSVAWGGIKMTDTGGVMVQASQFGKATVVAGTVPAGASASSWVGNRILGDITIGMSNSTFTSNVIGNVQITFAGGTSSHGFNEENIIDASAPAIADSSSFSTVVDRREMGLRSYTPAWTAVTSNPTLGNGSIFGRYSKRGTFVDVSFELTIGSTTTLGTGAYFFSLPFVPTNNFTFQGNAVILNAATTFFLGVPQTMQDGTARCRIFVDNAVNVIGPTIPGAWATNDTIKFTLTYSTQ